MRIGDLIECTNERDLKQTMSALELGGYNADIVGGLRIRITEVPETEYLVEYLELNGQGSKVYCLTEKVAYEVFNERIKTCEEVGILSGYPGEWTLVKEWHKN